MNAELKFDTNNLSTDQLQRLQDSAVAMFKVLEFLRDDLNSCLDPETHLIILSAIDNAMGFRDETRQVPYDLRAIITDGMSLITKLGDHEPMKPALTAWRKQLFSLFKGYY